MNLTNPTKSGKKLFNLRAEKLYRDACELFYTKNYQEALSLLEQTTKIDSTHTKAFLLTGDIKLLKEGSEQEALNAYDKALLSNPYSSQALGSKAYVLDVLGRYEEAFENCEKAFKCLNSDDNDQLSSLYDQKISLLCSLRKYNEATKTLNEAIQNLSEEHGNYLKSCYQQKIIQLKKSAREERQHDLKLIF